MDRGVIDLEPGQKHQGQQPLVNRPSSEKWAAARMHGGKAGRKPTHGRYTKAAIEARRDVTLLLRKVRALIGEAD